MYEIRIEVRTQQECNYLEFLLGQNENLTTYIENIRHRNLREPTRVRVSSHTHICATCPFTYIHICIFENNNKHWLLAKNKWTEDFRILHITRRRAYRRTLTVDHSSVSRGTS